MSTLITNSDSMVWIQSLNTYLYGDWSHICIIMCETIRILQLINSNSIEVATVNYFHTIMKLIRFVYPKVIIG